MFQKLRIVIAMLNELYPESKQVSIFNRNNRSKTIQVPAILTNTVISGALSTDQRNYSKKFTDDGWASFATTSFYYQNKEVKLNDLHIVCVICTNTKTLQGGFIKGRDHTGDKHKKSSYFTVKTSLTQTNKRKHKGQNASFSTA